MKYVVTFQAKKAIELLTNLNDAQYFESLNQNEFYLCNTAIAGRAIEMLAYNFTNEHQEEMPNVYQYECNFQTYRALVDFWCIFNGCDFYANRGVYYRSLNCARNQWTSAGSNNFEFENNAIREICLYDDEKMVFKIACDNKDYDIQEKLDKIAQDRYTASINLIGHTFYVLLTTLNLLTIEEK